MKRTDIINKLISDYGYSTYLEIGLNDASNFKEIACAMKESVDPFLGETSNGDNVTYKAGEIPEDVRCHLTYRMTSDELFKTLSVSKKYDIIFIDGLHTEEQVGKDIINSLKHLNPNGIIVVHDCLPPKEECQIVPRVTTTWNGDVWKAIPQLSSLGIEFEVVDTDYGCGIIKYYKKYKDLTSLSKSTLSYNTVFMDKNIRDKIMHVISVEEFEAKY